MGDAFGASDGAFFCFGCFAMIVVAVLSALLSFSRLIFPQTALLVRRSAEPITAAEQPSTHIRSSVLMSVSFHDVGLMTIESPFSREARRSV
jgi:hypothetical protein